MKNTYFLIDTAGQITPVFINPVPKNKRPLISSQLLKKYPAAGQVAFIEKRARFYRAQMMGGELSINGSLAVSYVLARILKRRKVKIELSGVNAKMKISLKRNIISGYFPISIIKKVTNNKVQLKGIQYLVQKGRPKSIGLTDTQISGLRLLTKNFPAAGIVFYSKETIKPLVYVKATNSFVWETACGSGSLAFYLIKGENKIKQPSGKLIKISRKNDTLIISMPVREVKP